MELLIAILVIVVIFIIPNIKVVPQARSYVIERLGSYLTTWNNGLHFKIPFVDRVSNKVSLKEIVKDFADEDDDDLFEEKSHTGVKVFFLIVGLLLLAGVIYLAITKYVL